MPERYRSSSEHTQVTELSTTTLMLVRTRNRMHPVTTFTKPAEHFPGGRAQGLKQHAKLASAPESEETPPRATSARAQKHAPGDEARLGRRRRLHRHKRWQLVWFWRGLAREAFPAPGRKARGGRKLSEKRSRLARAFGKRPEELERANSKANASAVVVPGLAEADEAEGPALGSS